MTASWSHPDIRLAGTLYDLYDKDTHIDRIVGLLDGLKAHENIRQ
jgi:hypothetical protein